MKTLQRIEYENIKNELLKNNESVKYFNFKWYQLFEGIYYKAVKNQDNSYYKDIFTTDFYNKNGCSYCLFLEIYYRLHKNLFMEV